MRLARTPPCSRVESGRGPSDPPIIPYGGFPRYGAVPSRPPVPMRCETPVSGNLEYR